MILLSESDFGQGVNDPTQYYDFTVKDCLRNASRYTVSVSRDSVRQNTQMKGQRIWRTISLDNRENQMLFNTNGGKCTQIGLFEVIKFGLFEKKLNAFSSDNFNEVEKSRMSPDDLKARISFRDTTEEVYFDAQGAETKSVTISNRYYYNSDIKSYLLKEDWIINSHSGKLEKKIVGLAPLVFDSKSEKVVPMFWLYYNEWKNLFASFEAKNFYSNERLSYREIFEKKYFISQVSKESNIFDRNIKYYKFGQESSLESEIIKLKLNNSEKDLFEH
jgi:hypothetical protein